MHFYQTTSFILPRSPRLRHLTPCLLSTHLPLICYCGWGLSTGRIALGEFILLTLATLIGTGIALLGIGALLNPRHARAETLIGPAETPSALSGVGDVIHRLYAGGHRAASASRVRMDDLHAVAYEDPLTGIADRRGFLAQVDALPDAGRRGCIAIVAIDHFEQVSDQLGHDGGQRILAAFAARLSAQIRRIDMVARWGGEEFVLLFQDAIEDEACWSLARIASRLRSHPVGTVDGRAISFSAGVARWGDDEIGHALNAADAALYNARRSGCDRVCRATIGLETAYP